MRTETVGKGSLWLVPTNPAAMLSFQASMAPVGGNGDSSLLMPFDSCLRFSC